MDIDKIVAPIADFIQFLIDFWVYGTLPDISFQTVGVVHSRALSLFLIAGIFNLLFRQLNPLEFNTDKSIKGENVQKVELHAVLALIPVIFLNVLFFELALRLFDTRVNYPTIGNFADSVNGHLLYAAAIAPIIACLSFLGVSSQQLHVEGKSCKELNWAIYLTFVFMIYLFWAAFPLLSFAMGAESEMIRAPYLVACLTSFIVGVLFGLLIKKVRQAQVQSA